MWVNHVAHLPTGEGRCGLEQIPIRLVGFGIEHLCGSVRKPAKALIPFPQTDVESALITSHTFQRARGDVCYEG